MIVLRATAEYWRRYRLFHKWLCGKIVKMPRKRGRRDYYYDVDGHVLLCYNSRGVKPLEDEAAK